MNNFLTGKLLNVYLVHVGDGRRLCVLEGGRGRCGFNLTDGPFLFEADTMHQRYERYELLIMEHDGDWYSVSTPDVRLLICLMLLE